MVRLFALINDDDDDDDDDVGYNRQIMPIMAGLYGVPHTTP
jgi:hypothetical protein